MLLAYLGGSELQPMAHVLQDPPGPSSAMDAKRMPGPSWFPIAIPFTCWPKKIDIIPSEKY
jgi:hypothetical protein